MDLPATITAKLTTKIHVQTGDDKTGRTQDMTASAFSSKGRRPEIQDFVSKFLRGNAMPRGHRDSARR